MHTAREEAKDPVEKKRGVGRVGGVVHKGGAQGLAISRY